MRPPPDGFEAGVSERFLTGASTPLRGEAAAFAPQAGPLEPACFDAGDGLLRAPGLKVPSTVAL